MFCFTDKNKLALAYDTLTITTESLVTQKLTKNVVMWALFYNLVNFSHPSSFFQNIYKKIIKVTNLNSRYRFLSFSYNFIEDYTNYFSHFCDRIICKCNFRKKKNYYSFQFEDSVHSGG